MSRRALSAALTTAALVLAEPSLAQTVYSGQDATADAAAMAFAAAIGPSTLETFDGRDDGELISEWTYGSGATASLSNGFGVTSAYPYGGGPVSPPRGYGAYPEGGVGGEALFSFTAPLKAFGAYFVDLEESAALVFTLAGGGTQTFAVPFGANGNVVFFGVDFGANTVTGLTVDTAFDDAILIDDVRVASIGGVPEPATWALMIAGFGVAGVTLRSRRKAAA